MNKNYYINQNVWRHGGYSMGERVCNFVTNWWSIIVYVMVVTIHADFGNLLIDVD